MSRRKPQIESRSIALKSQRIIEQRGQKFLWPSFTLSRASNPETRAHLGDSI